MEASNLPHMTLLHSAAASPSGETADEQCIRAPRRKAGGNRMIELRDWLMEALEGIDKAGIKSDLVPDAVHFSEGPWAIEPLSR